jgi:hypothetical protein
MVIVQHLPARNGHLASFWVWVGPLLSEDRNRSLRGGSASSLTDFPFPCFCFLDSPRITGAGGEGSGGDEDAKKFEGEGGWSTIGITHGGGMCASFSS